MKPNVLVSFVPRFEGDSTSLDSTVVKTTMITISLKAISFSLSEESGFFSHLLKKQCKVIFSMKLPNIKNVRFTLYFILTVLPVAILEWKKWGGHCGVKEKVGGQHKYLSCMLMFHCFED